MALRGNAAAWVEADLWIILMLKSVLLPAHRSDSGPAKNFLALRAPPGFRSPKPCCDGLLQKAARTSRTK